MIDAGLAEYAPDGHTANKSLWLKVKHKGSVLSGKPLNVCGCKKRPPSLSAQLPLCP